MRCPKCHYLSFDPEPRCKNCGYDLEVADAELAFRAAEDYSDSGPDLELRMQPEEPASPVTLELVRSEPDLPAAVPVKSEMFADLVSAGDRESAVESDPVHEPMFVPPPVVRTAPAQSSGTAVTALIDAPPRPPVARSPHPTTELPLFVRENVPPKARAPLAVRRTVADAPMPRTRVAEPVRAARPLDRRVGPLDHDLLEDLRRVEREEAAHQRAEARAQTDARSAQDRSTELSERIEAGEIPASQRLAAAALDGLLLGGIGTFVLWATLRLTGAGLASLGAASLVPFIVFLGGVSVAYLLMFTVANGQTIGKMLMGLRVVCDDDDDEAGQGLSIGQAALRAVLAPLSVLALGLGWVPALFGRGLALHDRLAHTRVIRA